MHFKDIWDQSMVEIYVWSLGISKCTFICTTWYQMLIHKGENSLISVQSIVDRGLNHAIGYFGYPNDRAEGLQFATSHSSLNVTVLSVIKAVF